MENYIVSARKYRPMTFDAVVGQKSITETLKNAIRSQQLAQAFLFTGPRGVGKTTCARILAKTINCKEPTQDINPCGNCESCISFAESHSYNIHELDAASNNSVDDIRNLAERVRIPPQVGRYKVYIIDEVHMLSQAAFNAFLKTLEEPPAYAKFILATTERHKIIPTILSRCQIYDFKRIRVDAIARHLKYVAEQESVEAEEEALHIIAQKADGALRDALSIFDQMVSSADEKITYKRVIENLNILDFSYYFKITDLMLEHNTTELLRLYHEIVENGFEGQHFIMGLGVHFRNLLVASHQSTYQLLETSEHLKERYKDQATHAPEQFLIPGLKKIQQADVQFKSTHNKRLLVELLLLELSQYGSEKKKPESAGPAELNTASKNKKSLNIDSGKAVKTRGPLEKTQVESTQISDSTKKTVSYPKTGATSFSIREALAEREKKEATQKTEVPIISPFSQQELEATWAAFTESFKDRAPSFVHALSTSNPVVDENFCIRYQLNNRLFAEDKINTAHLLEYLKSNLKNNQITLSSEIIQNTSEIRPSNDKERFEKMAAKNPMLLKLTDKLDLKLHS